MHPVFHISMLRKYVPHPSHVLQTQEIEVDKDLSYEEVLVAIVDRQIRKLRNKEMVMVKGSVAESRSRGVYLGE